jgi:hypothetical protein
MHLVVMAVSTAVIASCTGEATVDGVPSSTAPATSIPTPEEPVVLAYQGPCTATECLTSAAEIVGQIIIASNCVLLDRWDGTTADRRSYAIVFPFGVEWSDTEQGVLMPDGSIAHVGDWISSGGGASTIANIGELGQVELGQVDGDRVRACAAASEEPGYFLDLSPNGSVTVLVEAPADSI